MTGLRDGGKGGDFMKKVLIVSSSPRRNGNTEMLCEQFAKGALEAGNEVERINVNDKKIGYCIDCEVCRNNNGKCVIKDDAEEVIGKMITCGVLVLSTPVYFYSITAQLKTLIDRSFAREHEIREMDEKPVYYILSCAAPAPEYMDTAIAGLDGYIKCLRTMKVAGIVRGTGAMPAGAVAASPAMRVAYEMGKGIQ